MTFPPPPTCPPTIICIELGGGRWGLGKRGLSTFWPQTSRLDRGRRNGPHVEARLREPFGGEHWGSKAWWRPLPPCHERTPVRSRSEVTSAQFFQKRRWGPGFHFPEKKNGREEHQKMTLRRGAEHQAPGSGWLCSVTCLNSGGVGLAGKSLLLPCLGQAPSHDDTRPKSLA